MEIKIYTGADCVKEEEILEIMRKDQEKVNGMLSNYCFPEKDLIRPCQQFQKYYDLTNDYIKGDVSLFVATFSDHLLNGIRNAIKTNAFKDAKAVFIDNNRVVTEIKVFDNGKLEHWPDGMFDQWEKALMMLL